MKSARAEHLREARLDAFGIEQDRRWAVLGDTGRVLTQRECPVLATLSAEITAEGLELRTMDGDRLRVRRPDVGEPRVAVGIWNDTTEGASTDEGSAEWISRFLDRPARLVYMPESVERSVSPRFARPGDRLGFADGFPLLLTNEASLAALNERLATRIPMDRFRANLVVVGARPFAEDGWSRLRAGGVTVRVVKPCARCVVTTVDQETGIRGEEPLRTLADFRKRDGKVLFGQNLIHDGPGTVRVGDEVEILATAAV